LYASAVNLLCCPSLRILDFSPIPDTRCVSQAFSVCRREQNQRNRSKIQGDGKNERRVSRTRIQPIRCKIDVLIFKSAQRAAPDIKVAPESLGPVDYYSDTKPGYR